MSFFKFLVSFALRMVLLFPAVSYAQSCIDLMDSTEYYLDNQPERARYYGSQLLKDLRAGDCNQEIGIGGLYNNLGLIFWSLGNQREALLAFRGSRSFEIERRGSRSEALLDIHYNLATLYQEIGRYDSAKYYLAQSDSIIAEHFSLASNEHIRHLYREGIFFRETGDFRASMKALQEAEKITADYDLPDSVTIQVLIEMGTTYRHFGDLKTGETKLIEAIELAKASNRILYLTAIDRLSTLKIEEGQYADSESYLLHNLDIKENTYADNDLLKLETLNGLGILYYKLNDLASAEKFVQQALETTKSYSNLEPYMLNNLGTIYMKRGEVDRAYRYFEESAQGFRALFGSMHPDYASCLNNLAGAEKARGNLEHALNLYMRVLDMDKVIYGVEHQRYATTLNNIALLYKQLGNVSLAGKLLLEAKEVRKKSLSSDHPAYVKTLNDLGLYYLMVRDSLAALESFNEALYSEIHHLKDVFPVLTDRQRQMYYKQTKANIERYCGIAFSGKYLNTHWAEKGLNYYINTKGILFYASDKMRKLIQSSDDQSIKETYNVWREKKYKLAQSYLLSEEDRQKLGISVRALEEECAALEKRLALRFKAFAEQEQTQFHTWQEISSELTSGTVSLDIIAFRNYFVNSDSSTIKQGFEDQYRYVAFVIKPDSVLERISFRDDIDLVKAYSRYTNSLRYNLRDQTSYDTFWKPIDNAITGIRRIYFSPDGVYYKMNPGVYFDPYQKEYVADKYDIVNLTSSKDLLLDADRSFNRNAAIFGNPDFQTISDKVSLKQLPGAEAEANDISKILNVRRWNTQSYYFKDATEENVKDLQNPGVIHLATHGYFQDDPDLKDPLHSSGLYLSTQNTENDGILSAYEAMNLILDETNLVVLAACETGLGTVKNGEGVFGLQRSFLVAGADNILISLVKINDQAARRFMNLYYEQLLEEEDAQEAFFAARKIFKEEDKNPYNWGAYILVSK